MTPETLIARAEGARLRICANLPYNIATPLLAGWLEAEPWPPFYRSPGADVPARGRRADRRDAG